MIIQLTNNKFISDLQRDFSEVYSYLKIDFFKNVNGRAGVQVKQTFNANSLLPEAGLNREGELEVKDSMTVGELEHILKDKFGVMAQVSRKSGTIWLETTMTDNWTLKQQNDHGRELSDIASKKNS